MVQSWNPCQKFSIESAGRAFISKSTQTIVGSLKPILNFVSGRSPAGSFGLSHLPSRTPRSVQEPPAEFKCPICKSLLYDPVTAPTVQTFDRACIDACREFHYIPYSPSSSSPLELPSNEDLKSKILDWCSRSGHPHPRPISVEEARCCARRYMTSHVLSQLVFSNADEDGSGDQHQEPHSRFITTGFGESSDSRTSSSSGAADITCTGAKKATTAAPCSYFSRAKEALNKSRSADSSTASATTSIIDADLIEEEILKKLKDPERSVREEALATIYRSAKRSRDYRIALCSHKILANVIPKLNPRHSPAYIIKATAAIASLSEEPSFRDKIMQSGAVSRLVAILKNRPRIAAHAFAACVLMNLALEERNKEPLGSNPEAMSALVDHFCDPAGGYKGRKHAGMAICLLTSNFSGNLVRLAETAGAVQKLLKLAMDRSSNEVKELGGFAMVLISKLAWIRKAREALVDEGVVGGLVGMMREGTGDGEFCLDVLYQIQTCELTGAVFKALASWEGADEVLSQDKEGWGDVGREMARRLLDFIRQDDHEPVELAQLQSDVESDQYRTISTSLMYCD